MNNRMGILALIAAIALVLGSSVRSEDMSQEEMMKKMMEGYAKWSQPTKHHKAMEKLVGEYDVDVSFADMPMRFKGSATMKWVIPGKWMGMEMKVPGMAMGKESHGFALLLVQPLGDRGHTNISLGAFTYYRIPACRVV